MVVFSGEKPLANFVMVACGILLVTVDNTFNAIPILLFLYAVFQMVRGEVSYEKNLNPIYASFLFYSVPIVISILAGHSRLSYLDYPSRFLLFIPIGYLFAQEKIRPRAFLLGLALGTSGFFIALLYKYFNGIQRPILWVHPNIISEVSAGIFCFSFLFYSEKEGMKIKLLAFLTQVLSLGIVLLSASRGTLLSIIAIVCLYLFIEILININKKKYVIISLIVVIVGIVTVLTVGNVSDRFNDGFNNVGKYLSGDRSYSSIGYRLELWRASLVIIKDHPIIGSGNVDSYLKLKELVDSNVVPSYLLTRQHHHSDYVEALVTRGLLGILSVLALYLIPLVQFSKYLKKKRDIAIPAVLFVVSYMVCSLAEVPLWNGFSLMFYFLMITFFASQLLCGRDEQECESTT